MIYDVALCAVRYQGVNQYVGTLISTVGTRTTFSMHANQH